MSSKQDFDFLHGEWTVLHCRLVHRLANSQDWQEFTGTSQTRPLRDGAGNIEDNFIDFPGQPYRAVALRSFDAASGKWAIWWLDDRAPHVLDVPVIGGFADGRGEFLAKDTWKGQPILVRFLWLNTQTPTPRWEQAFSPDDGQTWETNWTMDFHRWTA